MQRAITVQCVSDDAESDFLSLNSYLYDGWRFVSATPIGIVGSSKIGSINEGYLLVLVIIENDINPRDIRHL